jgi:hypothetical protein
MALRSQLLVNVLASMTEGGIVPDHEFRYQIFIYDLKESE